MCCVSIHVTDESVSMEGKLAWLVKLLQRHNLIQYKISVTWAEAPNE